MSSTDLTVLPSLDLLAGTVEREHSEVVKAVALALSHALAAGDALLAAQDAVGDTASFERWVEERGLHYRTGQKYMRLATYRLQLEALPEFDDLSMTRANLYLRGLPKRTREDEAKQAMVDEIKRLHATGLGSREIARMVGCHRSTVRYNTDAEYRATKLTRDTRNVQNLRAERREAETVRRVEERGGPVQAAHIALVRIEESLGEARDASRSADERRDIQRAIDCATESRHWLARAIRSDLDHNHRTKVKHAERLDEREAA